MRVDIQFVNMPTSESMEVYTKQKLEHLAKKYDAIISVAVYFKRELKEKVIGRICEMNISLYGPRIFASSNEKNFELAVKNTISDLEKQLKKRKSVLRPFA